jgi:hypothetical protein
MKPVSGPRCSEGDTLNQKVQRLWMAGAQVGQSFVNRHQPKLAGSPINAFNTVLLAHEFNEARTRPRLLRSSPLYL